MNEQPTRSKGRKGFRLTPSKIAELFSGQCLDIDLPDDAEFRRLWSENDNQDCVIEFISEEWERLPEGAHINMSEEL